MENPRLSFITPTVMVGDKSLVSLIAHELAHSWSGNLVTNASWKDMWLNEGFTSYVENRIVESMYGVERAQMEDVISQFGLDAEMKDLAKNRQVLALGPLEGVDPDEALTDVAYIKGAWFLQFLEQRFGRETFDAFLRSYFNEFAFQSITTDQFVEYLTKNLLPKNTEAVTEAELDAWLNKPGIPKFATAAKSERFDAVDKAREDFLRRRKAPADLPTSAWTTQEWVRFLEGMPDTVAPEQLVELDDAFRFTNTPNGEIAQRWYPLTVRSGYFETRPAIADFLRRIGRRKLVMPTYEALAATREGREFARKVFAEAKPGYHPITSASVETALAEPGAK
jgi:aminopeptidase N